MKELSVTQEYLICAVNEKGKISGFSTEKLVCFVASALLDMQLAGCVSMDGKKATVTEELPAGRTYLRPLYDFIHQPKPVKLEKILEKYIDSVTDQRLNELMEAVGGSLEEMGLAESAKAGLLSGKKSYTPTKAALDRVIGRMRAAILEGGEVTREIAALVTLLDKSKSLKAYFSDHERREIGARLKEIVNTPDGRMLKDMIDYVDEMTAAMVAAISVLGI